MKFAATLAAATLLVLPLSWLSVRSLDRDAERFDRALAEVDHFSALQALLHRDVLRARAGMVRNYDLLARDESALDASLDQLAQTIAPDPEPRAALADLVALMRLQEDLVERIKTNNALLQNSLAFFSVFSTQRGDDARALTPSISGLTTAMLRLTLDTSMVVAEDVRRRLDDLARQAGSPVEREAVQFLIAHGSLLQALLPATDDMLKRLEAEAERSIWDQLRRSIIERQGASRAGARSYRRLLYIASVLLSLLLVYLGRELHARASALRRRAAVQHILAEFSLNLLNAPEGDIGEPIRQALADMARCIGADRAYLLFGGGTGASFTWCGPETTFALGWPAKASPLLDQINVPGKEAYWVPQVSRLPEEAGRAILAAAGLQGWVCASHGAPWNERALLGFDFIARPCRVMPTGELGLMRMTLDIMAGAFERRALTQDRTRLATRLEQARRLETVGTLASGIAHNFNNIVGAILGYTEMAHELMISKCRADHLFGDIQRAGERARELVDEILAFLRHRDKPHGRISLHALIGEAVSLLRASLPAGIELVVTQEDRQATVSGVAAQLQQVILNLCNNAAQAMDQVGRIQLEISSVEVATVCMFAQGILYPGPYARIAVIDSGCGIEKDKLDRIFEPFFTTRTSGSGLGLATSKEIVHEHGGAMHLSSTPGAGSRFEVWLPQIAPAVPAGERVPSTMGNGETILLVATDEQQLLRDEEVLAALGYEPVGFISLADACSACDEMPERFDLALIEHVGSATALLDRAGALHGIASTLPILAITNSGNALDPDALLATGISDVLPWPLKAAEIAAALEACLRRKGSGVRSFAAMRERAL